MRRTEGEDQEELRLRPQIGLVAFTVNVLGTLVGAGVFVLLGTAAQLAGSAVWLAFLLAALVAAAAALNYAELVSMYPRAGVEYEFVGHAFGRGVLPFLVGWVLTLNGSASVATLALGFAGYLNVFWAIPATLAAFGLVAVLMVAVLLGLKLDTRANLILTLIEVGGLTVFISLGVINWSSAPLLDVPQGAAGVLGATALVFFAYTGFEDASKMAEEVANPSRAVPVGLLLGLGLTALLYVSISVAAVQLAPAAVLAESEAPLVTAVGYVWGQGGQLFLTAIALVSITNTALFTLVAHSRLIFAMARGGSLPQALTGLLPRTLVPWAATLIAGLLAVALIPLGEISIVASLSSWSALTVYSIVGISLLLLRYRRPEAERPFRVPLSVRGFPVLSALSVLVSVALASQLEGAIVLLGLAVAGLGLIAYPLLRQR